jgi:phage/plasmid-associated DNA primase
MRYIEPGMPPPPTPASAVNAYRQPGATPPQMPPQDRSLPPPSTNVIAASPTPTDAAIVSTWMAECCHVGHTLYDTLTSLYPSWKQWVEARGKRPGSAKSLARALDAQPDLKRHHQAGTNRAGWQGLAVKREDSQAARL